MRPIRFSEHSELQMILREATKKEIEISVRSGQWERAKAGKLKTKHCFDFNSASPVNQKFYKYKTIEPIFAEESNEILIVTEVIAKHSIMPECFYRASMISSSYQIDSRSKTSRE